MSEQYKAALSRALIVGILSCLSTALTTWGSLTTSPLSHADLKTLIVAAGTAFLAPFIARFAGEGTYDTKRAQSGDVKPGDVKAQVGEH
jgi:hypothetical protein